MRIIAAIELAAAWISTLLFTCAGAFLTYEVVARYVFDAPTIWAAETSQLCLIWGTPIAMAWLLSARRHIRVNVLTGRMTPGGRRVAEVFSLLVIIAFSAVVTWKGWWIAQDSLVRGRTSGTMLDLPAWIGEAAIPAGFALLIAAALKGLIDAFKGDIPKDGEMIE